MRDIPVVFTDGTPVRPIPGLDDYYCSASGRVFSLRTGTLKEIRQSIAGGGYLNFNPVSSELKKQKTVSSHRIVASTWIDNPNNYPEINHKDGNKQNNCIENLEWCTRLQNAQHVFKEDTNLEPKTQTIATRLLESEWQLLIKAANSKGMTQSQYLRHLIRRAL